MREGPLDDAITFDGLAPISVNSSDDYTLTFVTSTWLNPGSTWNINRQPDWVATPVSQPVDGVFARGIGEGEED